MSTKVQVAKSNPTYIYPVYITTKKTILIEEDLIFASVLRPLAAYSLRVGLRYYYQFIITTLSGSLEFWQNNSMSRCYLGVSAAWKHTSGRINPGRGRPARMSTSDAEPERSYVRRTLEWRISIMADCGVYMICSLDPVRDTPSRASGCRHVEALLGVSLPNFLIALRDTRYSALLYSGDLT